MVKQGEIIKVNLNPKQGHEQQASRWTCDEECHSIYWERPQANRQSRQE